MKPRRIKLPSPPYLPGTDVNEQKFSLVFNAGGIGDYIHWVPAVRWAIEQNPQINGYVLTPPYFAELARHWIRDPRFTIHEYTENEVTANKYVKKTVAIIPDGRQYHNACGYHLTDVGFAYFNQGALDVPDSARVLPVIRGDEVSVAHFGLPEDYAVITVMATAENRRLPADSVNRLVAEVQERGLIPVFLGKSNLAEGYSALPSDGIFTEGVIDLRNKTTLLEAACIMARSRFTLGLDNGLLHLASCSKTPVVFLFTNIDPRLRVPRRQPGSVTVTVTPPESLTCRFCGTRMRYLPGHSFDTCLYKTNDCTKSFDLDQITEIISKIIRGDYGNEVRRPD
jgi:ADP-heptose:LPS heptosyltransferase